MAYKIRICSYCNELIYDSEYFTGKDNCVCKDCYEIMTKGFTGIREMYYDKNKKNKNNRGI